MEFNSITEMKAHYADIRVRLRGKPQKQKRLVVAVPVVEVVPPPKQQMTKQEAIGEAMRPDVEDKVEEFNFDYERIAYVYARFKEAPPNGNRYEVIRRAVVKAWNCETPLFATSHQPKHVRPRWIAWILTHHLLGASYAEIGRRYGRDHTSVIHAHRRIGDEISGMLNEIKSLDPIPEEAYAI